MRLMFLVFFPVKNVTQLFIPRRLKVSQYSKIKKRLAEVIQTMELMELWRGIFLIRNQFLGRLCMDF